jgi:GAF domain-containing protein
VWSRCGLPYHDAVFTDFKGLWGWVLDHRQAIMANDSASDPRSTGVPEGHVPIARFLAVPVLLGGR